MSLDPEYYRELLKPAFRGQRFLLVGAQPLRALAAFGRDLTSLGADPPFLLASEVGRDRLPCGVEASFASLELPRNADAGQPCGNHTRRRAFHPGLASPDLARRPGRGSRQMQILAAERPGNLVTAGTGTVAAQSFA